MPMEKVPEYVHKAEAEKLNSEKALLDVQRKHEEIELDVANIQHRDVKATNDENHVLAFYFPVQQETSVYGMQTLGMWARRLGPPNPDFPFTIEIGSPGGEVLPGLALIDYIRNLRRQGYTINTVGFGEIASMAGVLLQAGDKRTISENSYLLLHEPAMMSQGKVTKLRDEQEFIERLESRIAGLLSERSTYRPSEIIQRWNRKDWWLDSEEALAAGFVDEILPT